MTLVFMVGEFTYFDVDFIFFLKYFFVLNFRLDLLVRLSYTIICFNNFYLSEYFLLLEPTFGSSTERLLRQIYAIKFYYIRTHQKFLV